MIICSCNRLSDTEWRPAAHQVAVERASLSTGQSPKDISADEQIQQDVDAVWKIIGKEHVCRRCRRSLEHITREETAAVAASTPPSPFINA